MAARTSCWPDTQMPRKLLLPSPALEVALGFAIARATSPTCIPLPRQVLDQDPQGLG